MPASRWLGGLGGDWGPLTSLAGIAAPAAQPAPPLIPQPVAPTQFFGAAQKITDPNIAQIFIIIAAIEFVASPVAGMVVGSDNPKLGWLVFTAGMLNGLFFVAFAKAIVCLNEAAERLRGIETLLRNRP